MAVDPNELAQQQEQNALMAKLMATEQGRLELQKQYNIGLTDSIGKATTQLSLVDRLKNAWHNISSEASGSSDYFALIGKNLNLSQITATIDAAKDALVDLGKDGAFALVPLLNVLPTTRDLFGQLGISGMKAGDNIHDSFSKITEIPFISKELGKLTPALDRVFSSADKAQNLQFGLIAMAAASGNLNKVMESTGGEFQNLTDYATDYNERIYETAKSSGMLMSTVSQYASQLGIIPGALQTNIDTTDRYGNSLTELQASIKIASAFQIDHQKIVDQLNYAYRNFNTVGEKALQFVASMAQEAQDLSIPMDIVSKTTMDAASSFRLLGDNSQAAMNILANVSDALKGSNIGPEGIAEITGDMISGIKNLDVATKAFISSQAGGRGGLAGAFQIDTLLQQKKLNEVLQMTQSAMKKQFGAPIVTLEDVNKNPGQSGQLLKEVTFLKDIAHLAKSNEEAYRILEVMSKGGPGGEGFKGARTAPQEALEKAVGQGSSIQEKGFNRITQISNEILKVETITAASSLELTRKLLGTEGKGNPVLLQAMKDSAGIPSSSKKTTLDDQQKYFTDKLTNGIDMVKSISADLPNFDSLTKTIGLGKSVETTSTTPLFSALGLGPSKPSIGPESAQSILAPEAISQTQRAAQSGGGSSVGTAGPGQQSNANQQHILSDGTIKVEVDIKDGIEKIARATAIKVVDGKLGSFNGTFPKAVP